MMAWVLIGVVLLIDCRLVRFPLVIVLPVLINHFDIFKLLSQLSIPPKRMEYFSKHIN
jgi:hypothetical protein